MRGLLLLALLAGGGCEDIRTFDGSWVGLRVGGPEVNRGFGEVVEAQLTIETASLDAFAAELTTSDGLIEGARLVSVPQVQADSLAGLTFWGSPLRVYLAFAPTRDGGGEALALVGLFPDERVELRLMRGGLAPRYGVFSLQPQ